MKRHTIVIATDSVMLSAGLNAVLQSIGGISVEAKQVEAEGLLDYMTRYRPSAVIADLSDAAILSVLGRYRDEYKASTVLIGLYHSAVPQGTARLVDATISIYDSIDALSEILKRSVTSNNEETTSDLTPREKEVIRGIVKGLSNKEIASEINVSVNTVMTHRRNIASKLKIHSPAGLTIFAIVSKLVSLDEIKGIS